MTQEQKKCHDDLFQLEVWTEVSAIYYLRLKDSIKLFHIRLFLCQKLSFIQCTITESTSATSVVNINFSIFFASRENLTLIA